MQAQSKAAQELYKQAGAQAPPDAGASDASGSGSAGADDVIDAEVIEDEKAQETK